MATRLGSVPPGGDSEAILDQALRDLQISQEQATEEPSLMCDDELDALLNEHLGGAADPLAKAQTPSIPVPEPKGKLEEQGAGMMDVMQQLFQDPAMQELFQDPDKMQELFQDPAKAQKFLGDFPVLQQFAQQFSKEGMNPFSMQPSIQNASMALEMMLQFYSQDPGAARQMLSQGQMMGGFNEMGQEGPQPEFVPAEAFTEASEDKRMIEVTPEAAMKLGTFHGQPLSTEQLEGYITDGTLRVVSQSEIDLKRQEFEGKIAGMAARHLDAEQQSQCVQLLIAYGVDKQYYSALLEKSDLPIEIEMARLKILSKDKGLIEVMAKFDMALMQAAEGEEVQIDGSLKAFREGIQFEQIAKGMTQALITHYDFGE